MTTFSCKRSLSFSKSGEAALQNATLVSSNSWTHMTLTTSKDDCLLCRLGALAGYDIRKITILPNAPNTNRFILPMTYSILGPWLCYRRRLRRWSCQALVDQPRPP